MTRVRQTLEGFAQVNTVEFVSAKDQFELTYVSDTPMGEEFKDSIQEIIIFPGVRKFLGSVGDRLNNSQEESP